MHETRFTSIRGSVCYKYTHTKLNIKKSSTNVFQHKKQYRLLAEKIVNVHSSKFSSQLLKSKAEKCEQKNLQRTKPKKRQIHVKTFQSNEQG